MHVSVWVCAPMGRPEQNLVCLPFSLSFSFPYCLEVGSLSEQEALLFG